MFIALRKPSLRRRPEERLRVRVKSETRFHSPERRLVALRKKRIPPTVVGGWLQIRPTRRQYFGLLARSGREAQRRFRYLINELCQQEIEVVPPARDAV